MRRVMAQVKIVHAENPTVAFIRSRTVARTKAEVESVRVVMSNHADVGMSCVLDILRMVSFSRLSCKLSEDTHMHAGMDQACNQISQRPRAAAANP